MGPFAGEAGEGAQRRQGAQVPAEVPSDACAVRARSDCCPSTAPRTVHTALFTPSRPRLPRPGSTTAPRL